MRQKTLFCFIALLSAVASPSFAARYASIIVDEHTGIVLHAANPDSRVHPASLTKMMTLYMIFDALKNKRLTLNTRMTVSKRASRRPASKLGLKQGRKIRVRDVIGALVTKSANDAATVIAEKLGGNESRFARIMTAKARQLGMARTTFTNASGLPDRRQTSTARDMAKLAMALRRDFPKRFKLFSMKTFKYRGRKYRNHNRLLAQYKGTDGIKTGYVRASGFNIVVSIERNGHRLIAAIFGGKSARKRDRHVKTLLRRTFKMLAENDRLDVPKRKLATRKNGKPPKGSKKITIARIAPTDLSENDQINYDGWSVQVGAFERSARAHLAAGKAARLAPSLRGARIVVEINTSQKKHLYLSLLAGLTEKRANNACNTLKKKRMACLVVRDDRNTAQGDR